MWLDSFEVSVTSPKNCFVCTGVNLPFIILTHESPSLSIALFAFVVLLRVP